MGKKVVLVIEEVPDGSFGGYVRGRPVAAWGKETPEEVAVSLLEGVRVYEELEVDHGSQEADPGGPQKG